LPHGINAGNSGSLGAMKTALPRISSLLAAFLLSFGFARAAQVFDVVGFDQPSGDAAEVAAACSSPCFTPDRH